MKQPEKLNNKPFETEQSYLIIGLLIYPHILSFYRPNT